MTPLKIEHSGIARGLTIFIAGVILSVFLWWFFGGIGFWVLPGFAIFFIGIGEILYKLFLRNVGGRPGTLRAGVMTFFIGIALYASVATQILLAYMQMISLIVIALGIIITAVGMFLRKKQ